ncbi:MAG: ABC transporter permease [Candidatus Nanopelagicales bacterium]|nr:ABC transporter permease [Candidatus Nanopelagicales bacterium]
MTATGFSGGVRLVAGRAIAEAWASRSWRIITGVSVLIGIALVVVPRLLGGGTTQYTLATVGEAPPGLLAALQAAGEAGEFAVTVRTVPDAAAAEALLRDGDADAALTGVAPGSTLYVAERADRTFPALVSQAALSLAITDQLAQAGLSPDEIAAIQATPPPVQVPVGRVADEGRAGVGFVSGILLYLALILTGTAIATAVATEKSSRISEVLLTALRPTQLLVGTVLGVGLLGLAQIAAIAVPAAIGLAAGGGIDLPASTTGDILLALAWFVLGLGMYAFVFAALGALVDKPTEVGAATMPANLVLVASYMFAVIVTIQDPNGWASTAASIFPVSAPLVMPIRWASGLVPPWQLVLAMALVAITAVALALVASRIYARGLTRTGRRITLREVLAG